MSILGHVERLHSNLDYYLARQNLLIGNLSQVDTPGFRSRDLVRTEALDPSTLTLETTRVEHLAPLENGLEWKVQEDPGRTPGLDGNQVDLDHEIVKVSSNQLRYDALTTLTHQALSQMIWAANDGRTG